MVKLQPQILTGVPAIEGTESVGAWGEWRKPEGGQLGKLPPLVQENVSPEDRHLALSGLCLPYVKEVMGHPSR